MAQMLWVAANITLKLPEPTAVFIVSMLVLLDETLVAPSVELGVPSLPVCAMTRTSMLLSRRWVPTLTPFFPVSTLSPHPESTTPALTQPETPRHAAFTTWALQQPPPATALMDLCLAGRTAEDYTRRISAILLAAFAVSAPMHHISLRLEPRVLLPLVTWRRLESLGLLAVQAIPWSVVSTTQVSLGVI
jgi:hypothetical protein